MKVFSFFLRRMFFGKPLLAVATLVLFLMANYVTFTTARAVFSTLEGRAEVARISQEGTFIQNLDPDSQVDLNTISPKSIRKVYTYLNNTHSYALYTDGYLVNIPNSSDVEVPISYMNEKYNEINGFQVSQGSGLSFDYNLDENEPISVLVGAGLAKDYPIGTEFKIDDPALQRELLLKVSGVLAKNVSHSNFYALDSKQYYNFAIVIPVSERFLSQSTVPFKHNALMDTIITDTNRKSVNELGKYIQSVSQLKFNYYSQEQNNDDYYSYFRSSIIFLVVVTFALLFFIVIAATWSSLVNVRIMIKEFTINLLVGLDYSRLSRICRIYYCLIGIIGLLFIAGLASYSRNNFWQSHDVYFMTFGLGGLIQMDWLALLVTLIMNISVVVLISGVITWRIKRIPISIGVLQ